MPAPAVALARSSAHSAPSETLASVVLPERGRERGQSPTEALPATFPSKAGLTFSTALCLVHRPAANMSKLIGYLPPPLPLLIDVLNLRNPVNGVLFALATILTLRILLPPPPYVPAPYGLPMDPSEAYNWRPQKHPHTQLSRTWTPQELQKYDGRDPNHEDGRILFAIRRKVYDVTAGRSFYGPGTPPETLSWFLHPGRADTGNCPQADRTKLSREEMPPAVWPSSRSRPTCSRPSINPSTTSPT